MLMPTALGILVVIAERLQDRGMVRAGFDPLRLRAIRPPGLRPGGRICSCSR